MTLPAFRRLQQASREVSMLQGNVAATLDAVVATPFIGGSLASLQLVSGSLGRNVRHGLERVPSGWFLLDITAQARVWRGSWDADVLNLMSDATPNVKVWIF